MARAITIACWIECGPTCRLIGLGYECQLFDDLIVSPHDVFMDKVVTERAVYRGRGGASAARPRSLRTSRLAIMPALIDDTYAEAFRSIYVEFLITARDRHVGRARREAATGNGSSTILCDCEAGLDRFVGPGGDESFATPDGRPGAIVQLHMPRFRKDRVEPRTGALVRISQNVLTCPTAACFNLIDSASVL